MAISFAGIRNEDAYYRNFVGLARTIAPDGTRVNLVGFTTIRRGHTKTVALKAPRNAEGSSFLLSTASLPATPKLVQHGDLVEVSGTLKLADSRKKGKDEIQIVDAGNVRHRVVVPLGMMSDIVKPLWDTQVVVVGVQEGKKILLQDIRSLIPKKLEPPTT